MLYLILHITLEQDGWTKAPGGSTFEPCPKPSVTFTCAHTLQHLQLQSPSHGSASETNTQCYGDFVNL